MHLSIIATVFAQQKINQFSMFVRLSGCAQQWHSATSLLAFVPNPACPISFAYSILFHFLWNKYMNINQCLNEAKNTKCYRKQKLFILVLRSASLRKQ